MWLDDMRNPLNKQWEFFRCMIILTSILHCRPVSKKTQTDIPINNSTVLTLGIELSTLKCVPN